MTWFFAAFLSVICWGIIGIIDSYLLRKFSKNIFVLSWNQAIWSVFFLSLIAAFVGLDLLKTSWLPWLLLGGFFAYIGDLSYWSFLRRVEASVVNTAWVFHSLLISLLGWMVFGEAFYASHIFGIVLVIVGVLLLLLWGKCQHLTVKSLGFAWCVAIAYVPFYLVQKISMDAGTSVLIATFWTLFGRECLGLVFPLLVPKLRSDVLNFPFVKNRAFLFANSGVIALFFLAVSLNTFAIAHGPMTLVPVVWNLQPFVTLMLGWCVMRTLPKFVFTEDFSTTSMLIKVVSYSLTFLGLASIALHG